MNANRERIAFLLQAYTENRISKAELDELSTFAQQETSDPILKELMLVYWNHLKVDEELTIPKDEIYRKITANAAFAPKQKVPKIISLYPTRSVLSYVAAIVVMIGAGLTIYINQQKTILKPLAIVKSKPKAAKEISFGSKKAILTLADGSEVNLEESVSGRAIAFQGHLRLDQKNGRLVYNKQDSFFPIQDHSENTISTPKGGVYELVLYDGTKVWLNAGSSLTYPVVFSGKQRRVKVKGEAYFEVAKNPKMPFVVEANGSEIEVLGTHFNVSAYADDALIKTTLIEGAVKVTKNNQSAYLKPSQQASISAFSEQIKVKNVDTEEAMAWKNGYFMFNNEDIKTVMKQVSRWYNIEVEYRGELRGKTFGGTITRFGEITDLLKAIELTDAIHFEIQGRRIIVMP